MGPKKCNSKVVNTFKCLQFIKYDMMVAFCYSTNSTQKNKNSLNFFGKLLDPIFDFIFNYFFEQNFSYINLKLAKKTYNPIKQLSTAIFL